MRYARAIVIGALTLTACGREVPAVPASPTPGSEPAALVESESILNMARGASVVSRTAELTLEQTPARLIDGETDSTWATPFGDVQQSATFSLPAPARVTAVGIATLSRRAYAVRRIRFESSLDGVNFTPLLTQVLRSGESSQLRQVPARDLMYIRALIEESHGSSATLSTLHVRGNFIQRPRLPPISGCWSVNGSESRMAEEGGSVRGTITGDGTLRLDGGSEGLVYRFAWSDGPQYGLAAVTLTPDGRHLTGMKWHERAEPYTFGQTWFGETHPGCAPSVPASDETARLWLKRAGWYPLYGLHFDDRDQLIVDQSRAALDLIARLLNTSQKIQLTAHEMRAASPEANRKLSERRLVSLRDVLTRDGADVRRIGFLAAGSDHQPLRMPSELILAMYSMVDIRVAGSGV